MKFALDAITSFSYKPLKLASIVGVVLSIIGFLYLVVVLYLKLFTNSTVPGWASILAVNLLFNGVILGTLGVIGEYIGRIYDEAKGRPLYIVKDLTNFSSRQEHKTESITRYCSD